MIYTALILICQTGLEPNINTCVALHNQSLYETEQDCMDAVAYLLNSDFFKYTYMDYKLESYVCHPLLDIEV